MSVPTGPARRLTVAMIVRDCETLAARTLESIRDIANEIVVADTGSQDNTREVVAQTATRVLDVRWNNDFSAARNAVMEVVTGDWVLWLDAGETLSADDLVRLRNHIDHEAEDNTAYMSLVHLPHEPGSVSGEQVGRIRLMPRNTQIRFSGRVRESVKQSLAAAGIGVGTLPVTIWRDASDHLPHIKQAKAARDVELCDLEIESLGPQPRLQLAKAEALTTLGQNTAAREGYQQARMASATGSSEMLEAYYGELTTYDGEPEAHQKQISLCVAGLEAYPLDAQLLCAMGSYLQAQDRIDLATRAYQTCVEYGQVNPEIWHLANLTEVVTICLSMCLQMQSQDGAAREVLEQALAKRAQLHDVRRHLIELHVKHQRRQEALELVNSLPGDTPNPEALRSAIRGACLAVDKNWVSAKAYLQTAYHGGCREAVCFRWLTVTHLAMQEFDAAETLISQWCEHSPNRVEIEKYRQLIRAQRDGEAMPEPPVETPRVAGQPAPHPAGGTMRFDQPNSQDAQPSAPTTPHDARRAGPTSRPKFSTDPSA